MDQLDKFKKEWQTREQELPKVSFNDIYKMLLKKSSSIVKWIFIISVAELLFWIGLYFIIPEENMILMHEMGIGEILYYANIFHFAVFGLFIFLFYKNYQSIQVTDNTKMLMKNILNTRKTVRYFVIYNIGMFIVSSIVVDSFFYNNSNKLYNAMDFASKGVPKENFANVFIIAQVLVGVAVIGLLILFYWLVYGILLKRLNTNYKELQKMEN